MWDDESDIVDGQLRFPKHFLNGVNYHAGSKAENLPAGHFDGALHMSVTQIFGTETRHWIMINSR